MTQNKTWTSNAGRDRREPDSSARPRRLRRERRTLTLMVTLYCRAHHPRTQRGEAGDTALCPHCATLLSYALARLDGCPFGEDKPVCASCQVHCYRPVMRDRIRQVMRYSGPRMTYRHPYLALRHLLDRRLTPQNGDIPRKGPRR